MIRVPRNIFDCSLQGIKRVCTANQIVEATSVTFLESQDIVQNLSDL